MEGAGPAFPAWAAGAAGAGASPAVGHQPGGKCCLRNSSIPIHEFWSPPSHTTAGHPQPRTLCEPAQAAGSFCRVPVTAGIPWGASARWCFTHSKRDIYFVKKNPKQTRKPQARPVPGPLSAGDRYYISCGTPAVELSQFPLLPGLSQAPGIKPS